MPVAQPRFRLSLACHGEDANASEGCTGISHWGQSGLKTAPSPTTPTKLTRTSLCVDPKSDAQGEMPELPNTLGSWLMGRTAKSPAQVSSGSEDMRAQQEVSLNQPVLQWKLSFAGP